MVTVTLAGIIEFVTIVFVLSTMLSMGLGCTINQILASLGQRRLTTKALLVNIVLVPLLALLLIRLIPMESSYALGIFLIAIAPGASFGPKLAEFAEGDVGFAVGLMVIFVVVSVITIPLTVAIFVPGNVNIDPLRIAQTVFLAQLIPLSVGLVVKIRYERIAEDLLPPTRQLSSYSFVLLIGLLIITNISELVSIVGTGTLIAVIAVVGGALLLGYAVGGPAKRTRRVLATTTAVRNGAIALLIAATIFADPSILTMIVTVSIISVLASGVLAGEWGHVF